MRRCMAIVLAVLLFTLCGCSAAGVHAGGKTLHLFFPVDVDDSQGGDVIDSMGVSWEKQKEEETKKQVCEAVELLLKGYPERGCISPIPQGTKLQSCTVNSGAACLDFSESYGQLSGMDLSVADYCITLTLVQIPDVHRVRITVDGQELAYREKNVFVSDDVLLTSSEDIVRSLTVQLYFPDSSDNLTAEERILTMYEGDNPADAVLEALLAGPEDDVLLPLLPDGFVMQVMRTEDGICYVTLTDEDEKLLPNGVDAQRLLLQGITDSLCSLEGVEQVQFLCGGELRVEFGRIDISQPFYGK